MSRFKPAACRVANCTKPAMQMSGARCNPFRMCRNHLQRSSADIASSHCLCCQLGWDATLLLALLYDVFSAAAWCKAQERGNSENKCLLVSFGVDSMWMQPAYAWRARRRTTAPASRHSCWQVTAVHGQTTDCKVCQSEAPQRKASSWNQLAAGHNRSSQANW